MSEQVQRLANVGKGTGLPDVRRPLNARPIFLIVGMHGSGASMVAQMLQLLGVDMVDGEPSNDNEHVSAKWERPEIVAFNNRLLDSVGRPLGSAAHALPFAAGWWADPRVRSIKREIQEYLKSALEPAPTFWGFKDLRVTRLLPLWQQIFDDLGLRPIYLWTVRDPAEPIGMERTLGASLSASMNEVMWLIYNSEVCKYVGSDAAAVVDYQRWFQGPETIVQTLLGRLPLSWRGSQADLLECVRTIAPAIDRHAQSPRMNSPLVRSLYESILMAESEEDAERFRASVVQAVDIVRSLVAPYAGLIANSETAHEVERLRAQNIETGQRLVHAQEQILVLQAKLSEVDTANRSQSYSGEIDELVNRVSEVTAQAEELRHLVQPAAEESGAAEVVKRFEQEIGLLRRELDAAKARADAAEAETQEIEQTLSGELQTQIAQNDWLRKSLDEQQKNLREVLDRQVRNGEEMASQLRSVESAYEAKSKELQLTLGSLEEMDRKYREEILQISAELRKAKEEALLQKAANERYLARIYELKAHAQNGKPK